MTEVLNFYKYRTLIFSILMVFIPSYAFSEELVLVASQDTSITEHLQAGGAESNHGGDPIIQAIGSATFRSFPMIKFDFSGLTGSVVTGNALFNIYVRDIHPKNGTVQKNISLYTWSSLNWDENTITFSQVQFPTAPISLPSDLTLPKLGTVPIDISNRQTYISYSIPRAIVQGWIDDPASNHGLALVNEQTAIGHDVVLNAKGSTKDTEPTLSLNVN